MSGVNYADLLDISQDFTYSPDQRHLYIVTSIGQQVVDTFDIADPEVFLQPAELKSITEGTVHMIVRGIPYTVRDPGTGQVTQLLVNGRDVLADLGISTEESQQVKAITHIATAGAAISALTVVWQDETGLIWPLSSNDDQHQPSLLGVTTTAGDVGAQLNVYSFGEIEVPISAVGRVWCNSAGALSTTPPETGVLRCMGTVLRPTRLMISIEQEIYL